MRNGIDWKRPILTWEHFTLNPEGPNNVRVEVGLVSLDGAPCGSVFPDRKLLTTREHAEVLAMSAGAQFLAVPYTRAVDLWDRPVLKIPRAISLARAGKMEWCSALSFVSTALSFWL